MEYLHEIYMKKALELAINGWGTTNPNPLVGAVIVKDGWIIGEGFHERPGEDHAEAAALKNATQDVRGATLYVNLEPCSHFGHTPPCANAIIQSGISNVVIGMKDPNPLVAGKGIKMLEQAGIQTTVGVLENESKRLNEIFIKYITHKRPFVTLKTAMSMDGKICTSTGQSKWITSEESRRYVHHLRNRAAAIMVGTNTLMRDNPSLTTRLEGKSRNAVRIILDRTGRVPLDSNVFNKDSDTDIIVATSEYVDADRVRGLECLGTKVLKVPENNDVLSLSCLMDKLCELEIDSILLEGGGEIGFSALKEGIVDKVMIFIAPLIIGGREALTPIEGEGFSSIEQSVKLKNISTRTIGNDILVEGYTHELFEIRKGEACVHRNCGGNGCCKGC